MKKFVFGVLLMLSSAVGAQVTGPMRQTLINSTAASCFQTQRAASVNNTVDSAVLRKYCNCTALYYADTLHNELIKSIENGEQKLSPDLPALAGAYCQKNFSKY